MDQPFWRLVKPVFDTISKDNIVNGYLNHPYGLPGVECEKCKTTWGGSRVLPFALPDIFLNRKEFQSRWPVPAAAHAAWRKQIEAALHSLHNNSITLAPGDEFQPGYLTIGGPPKTDFLWSGLASFCISERVKDALTEQHITGTSYLPVSIKKMGKGKSKPVPLVVNDGVSKYEINPAPLAEPDTRYYEVVITAESKLPAGVKVISTCLLCGRQEMDTKKREFKMNTAMWNGEDIFFFKSTLYPVVTDRVKRLLEALKVSNLWIERI